MSFFTPIRKIYFNFKFNIKEIIYIWISSLVSLLIIVNLFLKNLWGRARPNDIQQLGGKDFFTPWYQISDQCGNNCSFVSGDSSVGFALIVFYFLLKKEVFLWLSLILGFCLGFIRILEGGHFFSDIIFSFLVMFSFCVITFKIYCKKFND